MGTTIADRLRALRVAANLTQEQVADRAGLKQSAISKYETGTVPDVSTLLRLAIGLGVSVEKVVEQLDEEYDAAYQRLAHQTLTGQRADHGAALARFFTEDDTLALANILDKATGIIELGEQIRSDWETILGRQAPDPGRGTSRRARDVRRDRGPSPQSKRKRGAA